MKVFSARLLRWSRPAAVFLVCGSLVFYVLGLDGSGFVVALLAFGAGLACGTLFGAPFGTTAVGCFIASYMIALLGSGESLDPGAPSIGVAVFLLIELLHTGPSTTDRTYSDAIRSRRWFVFTIAVTGLALSSLALAVGAAVRLTGSLAVGAGGAAAAVLLGAILYATRSFLAATAQPRQDR
ncbi:MAG: hypothetical protein H0U53_09070 [Actinobacteria bacterium]|nr:hypothetical protein [Actinomycetota bacterium]